MAEVLVPLSVGEIVDKVTILRIKSRKISDATKLRNVASELAALEAVCGRHGIDLRGPLVGQLESINEKLWKIEDDIRDKERDQAFDSVFIGLARAVYLTNDERFEVKAQINREAGSAFHEVKSYQKYR